MPYRAGEMTEGYKDMPSFLVGCTSEKGERVGTMIIRFRRISGSELKKW